LAIGGGLSPAQVTIGLHKEEQTMDKTFTLTIEAKNTIYTVDNLTMNGNNYVNDSEIKTSG
jgi:hypothetical protein